jgi:AP endonuclease-1
MSRRASKKIDTEVLEDTTVESIVTPKKGRKAVKVEVTKVVAKVAQSPTKSNKKAKVEVDSDDEPLVSPKKSAPTFKINRVKAKAVLEQEQNSIQKKAPGKRKAKIEEDDSDRDDKKTPKKRKTKEEKEAEAMPLAARTPVSTLKKAIYVGAHVSGAGGESRPGISPIVVDLVNTEHI